MSDSVATPHETSRAAVMQPYVFPYVGYFQLFAAVDTFVFYDDVDFIRRGWMRRNRLLLGGRETTFSVPVNASRAAPLILETTLAEHWPGWVEKFSKTLRHAYARAPFVAPVTRLVEGVLRREHPSLASLAIASIEAVADYLSLSAVTMRSSVASPKSEKAGTERILEVCARLGVRNYLNAPGGRDLYDPLVFARAGVRLGFLKPELKPYPQLGKGFVPGLSIIDLLMNCDVSTARALVESFDVDWR